MKIEIIEGDIDQFGGYSINGIEYRSEEAEALVDEAKQMAYATGNDVESVLAQII